MRALRDQDHGVSSLAAEALGQMGESADGAIPALVRSLRHLSPEVRRSAAQRSAKWAGLPPARWPALENAARDDDGGVRSQAVRALGALAARRRLGTGGPRRLSDRDPLVRAAAIESLGQSSEPSEAILSVVMHLLEDANDQVKVAVTQVLPNLAGATPAVIEGLCRRLLEDDSDWVQVHAALALGQLGPAATAAGEPLLRAAQTGVVSVREQAMRAIAKIQPPETAEAFAAGIKDACGDVRMVASAGWMNATAISEEAIPALIEALCDPEVQVRANCARPGPARHNSGRGHPSAHRVYGPRPRRIADERGNGAQAGPRRRDHRGDAAPGRGPELARALDRRELPPRHGIGPLNSGRSPAGSPGRPGPPRSRAALDLLESLDAQEREFLKGLKNPTRPDSDGIELREGKPCAAHNLRSSKTKVRSSFARSVGPITRMESVSITRTAARWVAARGTTWSARAPRRSARCEKRGVKSSQEFGVAKLGTDGPARRSRLLSSAWWIGPPPIPRHGPPRATNRMTRPPSRSPRRKLLADSGSKPGVNASPLFKEPAAWVTQHDGWA